MPDSNTHHHDSFNFLFDLSQVSPSQEQLLRAPSVGPHTHHSPSPSPSPSPASADSPPRSNTIVMVSPPDSLDAVPQEVFHTPPENSSRPSSCNQPRAATTGDHRCAVNHAVDVDAGTQGFVDLCEGAEFVDLGRDSELGFSESSLGARRDVLDEIRDDRLDEFAIFERELSDLGEPPVKKPKLSEGDLGVDSSGGCVEVQSQKGEEGVENCEGNLVSEAEKNYDENNCSTQNLETLVGDVSLCESEKVACTFERNKSSDGVVEGSGMGKKSDRKVVLRELPPSMRGPSENAASKVEFGNSQKKNVFDVLRVLSEISNEEDENLDDISLLEVAEACGITFPRPRWWPKGENFDPL
ncbi:unnamed protein product [Sphenostylis stenocarpa]|uniref:Uncharacterized protein n=1 Tax=Sphenostylis stenocarpa TaxID=92480 RepID=A0AA86S6J8_9FABA|nr:unnamed protein product [Sphenostylis stenocarpa]